MNEADKKRLEEMQAEARTVPLSEKERWLIDQLEAEAAEVERLMVLGVRYSDERIAAEATRQSLRDQNSYWAAQALEAEVRIVELEARLREARGIIVNVEYQMRLLFQSLQAIRAALAEAPSDRMVGTVTDSSAGKRGGEGVKP